MKKNWMKMMATALVITTVLNGCSTAIKEPEKETKVAMKETIGTTDAAAEPVTLTFSWWGSQARHDYTQRLLNLYTELHPNVTFETSPSSWDGYFDKLSTQAAGGTMPDIMQMDYLYISTYTNNDTLADLQPYIDDKTIDVSNIDEEIYAAGKIGDRLTGMALSSTVYAMMYSPEVLAEAGVESPKAGWTWSDFIEDCVKVKEKTGKWGFFGNLEDSNWLLYWVRQYGVNLFNDEGTALGYDDDSILVDFFDMQLEMLDKGVMPNPDEYAQLVSQDFAAQPMAMNEAAFNIAWNSQPVIVQEVNPSLELAVMPTNEIGEKALWLKPGSFLSVSEKCEHKKEAAEFINWFVNSKEANDIIMAERGTPINSEIRSYLKPKLTEAQGRMFDYVDTAIEYSRELPPPDPEGISEVTDRLLGYYNQVLFGVITPKDAASAFRKDANKILEKNSK